MLSLKRDRYKFAMPIKLFVLKKDRYKSAMKIRLFVLIIVNLFD